VEGAWYVILRDIMIILAAAALVLMSLFAVVVLWQLYRLGKELSAEVQPVIESMQETTETVKGTAGFMSDRMSSPASSVVSVSASSYGLVGYLRSLRRAPPPADSRPAFKE
jgi:hypothetical protein